MENVDYTPSKIVQEIIDKREESSKTFLCEDGSYIAVTYSEPVHFKNADEWQEINNTLVLSDNGKYAPVSVSFDINLPLNISDNNGIIVGKNGYEVSFVPVFEKNKVEVTATAVKTDVEKLASNSIYNSADTTIESYSENPEIAQVEKYNASFTSVKNQKSALVYKDVVPGVDYEYIVSSNALKENIVINRKQEEYNYSFEIDAGGLTPKCNENGSISFIDKNKDIVLCVPAPYMYDMNKIESSSVEMSLEKSDEKYVLTFIADNEWINAEERAFPVIIDPTYNMPTDSINNVFVEDLLFADSTRSTSELRAGKNLTNLTRSYIRTILPTSIPYGSVISSAKLTLYKENYFQAWNQSNINIIACDCSNVSTWNANTVTWNNQPFSNSANGYQNVSGYQITSVAATSDKTSYVFELKTAAQKWLNTGTNKGIMLASSNENSKTQVDFYSTRANSSTQKPKMVIVYNERGVNPSSWNAPAEASTSSAISVVCSPSWTITSNQSWLTYSNKTVNSFKIKCSKYTGVTNRQGELIIQSGTYLIGIVTVIQSAANPNIDVNKHLIIKNYNEFTDSISINTATSWTVTKPSWISVDFNSGEGNENVTISVDQNTGNSQRSGNVTISNGVDTETVKIIQLDETSDYFCNIDNNDFLAKSSSEYNHPLAKWCMRLSHEAYNFPDGTSPIQLIPFMIGHNSTTKEILENKDFEDVEEYNYGLLQQGAHTIGHRDIVVNCSNGNCVERPLIMVVVRGTVTIKEFGSDLYTQLDLNSNSFMSLAREVCNNIISYANDNSLTNPIVVVTGHSMGAAIANNAAALLNSNYNSSSFGQSNIYCYTFATPKSVNEHIPGDQAVAYSNIFNILNTGDGITYMPYPWQIGATNWKRNGNDYYINMPLTPVIQSEPLGLLGHAMSTYQNWLDSQSNLNQADLEQISQGATAQGLLPIVLRVKCPVSVTLTDENDNIIAFESQQESVVYPELTDIGVLSFITENNEKVFFIPPNNDDITVSVSAYDYGNMNYAVSRLDFNDDAETIIYNNVLIYPDKEFEMDLSSDYDLEDIPLNIVENGVIVGEVTETDPPLKSVSVSYSIINNLPVFYLNVITSVDVSEIRITDTTTNSTYSININTPNAVIVVGDDDMSWEFGYYCDIPCDKTYNMSVCVNNEWHYYNNAFQVVLNEMPEN